MTIDGILETYEKIKPVYWNPEHFRKIGYPHYESVLLAGAPQLAAEVIRMRECERVPVEAFPIDLIDYACLYAERLMIDMDVEHDSGRKTVLRQRIDKIFAMGIKARAALEAVKE